jgi:hypothetical protein
MGDSTWVSEVVDAGLVVLRKEDGGWEEIMKDGVGVWYINDTLILCNLGDEISTVQVITNGHSQSKDQSVRVVFHDLATVSGLECLRVYRSFPHLLDVCLSLGIERAVEIGLVSFKETGPTNGVLLIIGIDAAGSENSEVNLLQKTAIS